MFETRVQASFAVLMLASGFSPCLPCWKITKIVLQGKYQGYDTDDLIVFVENPLDGEVRKLLGQVKHSLSITEKDKTFGEVIQSAWKDFNNPRAFTKGKDVIALITGPLSATDTGDVRTILEWARTSGDAVEFMLKVNRAKFSSEAKKRKLQAFRAQLKKANDGKEVGDEDSFQFLRHFHLLGYDLDIKGGVALSLLHSIIGQYSSENASALWAQLLSEVETCNMNAGTLNVETLPDHLQAAFQRRPIETIPSELVVSPLQATGPAVSEKPLSEFPDSELRSLAVANLLGSWNDQSVGDMSIIGVITKSAVPGLVSGLRKLLMQPASPVSVQNGVWKVSNREDMLHELGERIFDSDLEAFKESAIAVLTERDPALELPPRERYAAAVHGKLPQYSNYLRSGVADGLAVLGSHPEALTNCSRGNREHIASLVVRDILAEADWGLWASLNALLPSLAEASPDHFLEAVENALGQNPCPFDEVFAQEESGITGRNYITGLLWALESLAWMDRYLVRVTVILGELALHDPGGTWGNRPANSLTDIFLPWYPQTAAPFSKRKVAVHTLEKEAPAACWRLLVSLLPGQRQASSGTHRPKWRQQVPNDAERKVTASEYWEQVSFYADMAVDVAQDDTAKMGYLVRNLDHLPLPSFESVLAYLSPERAKAIPQVERTIIWNNLSELVAAHRKFPEAQWAMAPSLVSRVQEVADRLAPHDPTELHQRLFSSRYHEFLDDDEDGDESEQRFAARCQSAVRDILDYGGLDALLRFAENVENPYSVGLSLGYIGTPDMDGRILPGLLVSEGKAMRQFTDGFSRGRYESQGWEWVDGMDTANWSTVQVGQFFASLPFAPDAWERAEAKLGLSDGAYWQSVNVSPYRIGSSINHAIEKLIQHDRPTAAIFCLGKVVWSKEQIDERLATRALLQMVSSPDGPPDAYRIGTIIKALQNDPAMSPDNLVQIEWANLPLLDGHNGAIPVVLEKTLASDPGFFCQVISLIYHSANEPKGEKTVSDEDKARASNAYHLLWGWRVVPGMHDDKPFSGSDLKEWVEKVKRAAGKSGRLAVAMNHVGQVLLYSPPDPDGLWIHRSAADILNAKDAAETREGFAAAVYNSRGAHVVDPSGEPERQLASKYRQQAEEIEDAGYHRLAVTLRSIAEGYERDARTLQQRGEM